MLLVWKERVHPAGASCVQVVQVSMVVQVVVVVVVLPLELFLPLLLCHRWLVTFSPFFVLFPF